MHLIVIVIHIMHLFRYHNCFICSVWNFLVAGLCDLVACIGSCMGDARSGNAIGLFPVSEHVWRHVIDTLGCFYQINSFLHRWEQNGSTFGHICQDQPGIGFIPHRHHIIPSLALVLSRVLQMIHNCESLKSSTFWLRKLAAHRDPAVL